MIRNANVLVVDDEEVMRLSYSRILSGAHCNVQVAWDGKEAVDAMEHDLFDVVLLDLRLPGTDGMSVLRTIKERWPEAEVIVITGYPSVETAKEAVRLGAHDYLAKPVGPEEVIHAAASALTQKQWALRQERTGEDKENVQRAVCR